MRASSPYPHGMDVESGFHIAGAGAGAGTGPYNAESNASHLSGLICRYDLTHHPYHFTKDLSSHQPTNNVPFRRTNLAATLANALISPTSKYGKVFPHMGDDGRYPTDFNTPKTVETMKVLDSKLTPSSLHSSSNPKLNTDSQLDRIMQSYRLPLDLRALPSSSASASGRISPYSGGGIARDPSAPISSSRVRQAKLFALWEFLGCWKLVEHERLRRGGGVMY